MHRGPQTRPPKLPEPEYCRNMEKQRQTDENRWFSIGFQLKTDDFSIPGRSRPGPSLRIGGFLKVFNQKPLTFRSPTAPDPARLSKSRAPVRPRARARASPISNNFRSTAPAAAMLSSSAGPFSSPLLSFKSICYQSEC